MNTSLMLSPKVAWEIDNTQEWEKSFYPSLVQKIKNSHDHFSSAFSVSFEKLTKDSYLSNFYPVYVEQIARRETYNLDLEEQRNLVLRRIEEIEPITMIGNVFENTSENFVGGVIFSIWKDRVSVTHRVFDREINKKYRKSTTLDFWFEAQFREFSHTLGLPILTHGQDSHPFTKRVGLAQFKLRVGGKPYTTRSAYEPIPVEIESIKNTDTLMLYFASFVGRKYTKAVLVHTSQTNQDVLASCKAILEWTDLTTEYIYLE